jgi:hypothetical protein
MMYTGRDGWRGMRHGLIGVVLVLVTGNGGGGGRNDDTCSEREERADAEHRGTDGT